jgi:hypothetical protein
MSVAVLDVGKTNVKVVLFGDDGAMLTERSRPNAALPPDPRWPYPRLDVEMISSFLMASLAELNAIAPIATISITNLPISARSTPNTTRSGRRSPRRFPHARRAGLISGAPFISTNAAIPSCSRAPARS